MNFCAFYFVRSLVNKFMVWEDGKGYSRRKGVGGAGGKIKQKI